MQTVSISMTVNGRRDGPHEVPDGLSMNDYLREYLNLTGTKFGCGIGECSACVIIHDKPDGTSEAIHTCINGAESFDGQSVRTIEGIARTACRRRCRPPSSISSPSSAATARRASSTRRRCWWKRSPTHRSPRADVEAARLRRRSTATSAAAPAMSATTRRSAT